MSHSKPRIAIVADDSFAGEGGDRGSVLITRIGSSLAAPLVVNLSYSGSGTTCFSSLPSSVTIAAGQASTRLNLTPDDNTTIDAIRSLVTSIVADSAYDISSQNGSASLTIADNDTPVVTIQALDATAAEPSGKGRDTGLFVITRTGPTDTAMTVYYAVGGTARNGADFGRLNGQTVIAAGARKVSRRQR